MILVSGLQLSRIAHWVKDIEAPPPPSVGPWDEILAPIYRQLRKDKQDLTELNHPVDGIMLAAEALHDVAITLDAAMFLPWCNQTAIEPIFLIHIEIQSLRERLFLSILISFVALPLNTQQQYHIHT